MVMNIDESRRENQPLRVNNLLALRRLEHTDLGDAITRNAHADFFQRRVATIRHLRIDNYKRSRRRQLLLCSLLFCFLLSRKKSRCKRSSKEQQHAEF